MNINNISQNTFQSFNKQKINLEAETEKKEKNKNKAILMASVAGAIIPLALYNIKKGKLSEIKDTFQSQNSKLKDKILAPTEILEVENIKQIGISVTGSILASLGVGLHNEKNQENKKSKYKEAIYGFLNCMIPMGIITGTEAILNKKHIKTGIIGKAATVAGGVIGGMFISNKVANGLNKAIFKEEDKFEKRNMKPTDCLVHMDDILGVMVISKVPMAKQFGKVLPAIYSHVGYETGTKSSKKN